MVILNFLNILKNLTNNAELQQKLHMLGKQVAAAAAANQSMNNQQLKQLTGKHLTSQQLVSSHTEKYPKSTHLNLRATNFIKITTC